ncbi:lamin tail domain-containing protein [Psychroserpens sp.]
MRKNYALIVIAFLCGILSSFGQVSDLIISEYGEGSSGNSKYVEIYNGTGATVDLANYQIWRVSNGGTWVTAPDNFFLSLSGNLLDGVTYVIANNVGDVPGADFYNSIASWNGDDAVGLAKDISGTFTLIDAVGTDGPDPGSGWAVAGTTNGTVNNRLTRKIGVCNPNTNWTTSAGTNTTDSEWIVSGGYTTGSANAGHTSVCTDTYLNFAVASSSLVENGVSINICVSILNPSASVATTVDVVLDGSSSATNGFDYDDGAGPPVAIAFPLTLNFPANTSADQCFTIFISYDDLIYEGDETIVLNLSNPTGGISAALGGTTQHVLTIVDNETPVIADVIITEIMYNSIGSDDDWIEICNTSGVSQVLNDYTIEVNNTTIFTFPSTGTSIASGDCITINIGETLDGTYNLGCPFTPDYSSVFPPILPNSPNSAGVDIEIIANDGITLVDIVNYDDADGGDGNGSSLHFNTNAADNSDTGTDWHEVAVGGSPGINSLISQCDTPAADINVTKSTFSTIPDGSTASTGFNTVFAATPIGSSTVAKTYYILNEGNLDLVITSISLDIGTNFSLQNLPILPLTITPTDPPASFEIVFNPQSPIGTKTDTVRIINSDPDIPEATYTFDVEGDAVCAAGSISVLPTSGPSGTVVTVTGTNLATATATFNGTPASFINNISSTIMEVTVPSNALSGTIEILDGSGCPATAPFTVIDTIIDSCEGNSPLTELFISEVTDATYGSLTYIEIYNPTASNINLTDYEIRIYANGSDGSQLPTPSDNPLPIVQQLSGTINAGQTFVLTTGTTGVLGSFLCSTPGGDGTYGDQVSSILSGVNVKISAHDFIGLYDFNTGTIIDAFGGFADDSWMDALTGAPITGDRGFDFRRLNTASPLPNSVFDETQWNIIDWSGSGSSTCVTTNDYSDIGSFDFSTGIPPILTSEPVAPVSPCDLTASFTVVANQGFAGGFPLAYQWFVSIPGNTGWTALSNGAPYSGVTTATLNISNTIGLYNYQYYCQVRENTVTCYTASEAVRIKTLSTTWVTPGTWTNGTPDINTIATLDFNYDTTTNGSFSACSLTINSGTLNIRDGDYVEINSDLIVNSTLDIENEGSLVMIDDTGTVTNNGTTNVHKTTTDMETFDYTYWSSPIDYSSSGITAQTVLAGFRIGRIYSFNTSQFFDVQDPDGVPGADGFDDTQDAWTHHYATMSSGNGYAAMTSGVGVHQRSITFNGRLNTGIITVPVALSQNAADTTDDWNLLGNPYPSAIFVDEFVAHNTNLSGTVYLWTHEDDISISNPGPAVYNFNSNDYAMYNSVGGVGTSSTGTVVSNVPTGYIASGQGFFIDAITAGNVEFTNNMRNRIYNNNDFFRNSEASLLSNIEKDRMWINMTNSDGAFSQILIGYVEDATLEKDRLYDGIRLKGSNYIDFYSKDATNQYEYGIQGRPTFTLDDIIPIGHNSRILGELTISLYETEGILNDVTVYLKDKLLNTVHDLTESDYIFTTSYGNSSDRFEIVFQSDALSIEENEIDSNQLTIVELQNGSVKFSVGNNLTINTIEIIDLLGRTLYNLKGNNSTEIFELNNLSQTVYIAKVNLSNGQTITKRAVKSN